MIQARLFDKHASNFVKVTLQFEGGTLVMLEEGNEQRYALDALSFSERLGTMPRSITLPDGRVCETLDNDAVDAFLRSQDSERFARFIHFIESKSIFILPALAMTALLVFVLLSYVLPYSAEKIAYAIPQSIASKIGTGTLEGLDKIALEPSKLATEKTASIIHDFKQMSDSVEGVPPLKLIFRSAEKIGPNAFALPDGTIVMTDQLVLLSKNHQELLSILAHEIGHIKNRHAIRMVLQNSAMLLLLSALTGDASSASGMVATLPSVLIESAFSRDLENEADDFALALMQEKKIPLHYFADIMTRITEGMDEDTTGEYFASHPITEKRIAKFRN